MATTDGRMIERAKDGDGDAFQELYNMHKRRVFGLCFRMTGNAEQAEDLTQDTFLQVYRKLKTFRGESAFTTWLHRVAVNAVLMRVRRKFPPEVSLEEWSNPTNPNGSSGRATFQKEIARRDLSLVGTAGRLNLDSILGELPPGYRMIFVLHDIHGYEHNEIAEILDCSIGNSKSQLHKARMKLRALLRTGELSIAAASFPAFI